MEAISPVQTWLYDNLPVAVAIFDRDLVYRYANSAYAATQGQPAASLRGRRLGEIDSAWTHMVRRMIDRALAIQRPVDEYNISLTYPRQPSIRRTWDVTAMALIINDEVDGYVVYMLDVTDRREARRSNAAEKRLRSILDTAIDAILVIDEDGIILEANPATSRVFGYTNEELVGQPVTMVMPSPYKEEHGRFVERYLQTNVPHIIGTIREVQGRRKDGEIFPMELSVAESQEYGPERHFVGIIRDVTERKRLEEELKAADRAKDAFLALITHELRSPLAAIISWADLALDDPALCGEAMQVVQRSAQAQRRIIDDLLDISRVIYGKLSLDKQPVDAWEIARRRVEEQRRTIEEKGLTLELQPPPEPLPVLADPVRLEQIVNNLLGNAVKFTPAGGRITMAGAREGNMARLRVSDTGVGIAPEQLPLIFERFQQIGRERVSGGLGLGLALVKGLVEMHGGKVKAESPGIGKGSMFTVWLPLREE